MSAVPIIYVYRLLLNSVFFTLTNSAHPYEMPHDGIIPVYKCKKHVSTYILR